MTQTLNGKAHATTRKSAEDGAARRMAAHRSALDAQEKVGVIRRVGRSTIEVPIIGTSPLIVHNWSEKAVKQMLNAMQGVKLPKEKKDPEREYEQTMYRFADGGHGMPTLAFKAAIVDSARLFDKSVTMVALRQQVFLHGERDATDRMLLVRILGGAEPVMREDPVKVGNNGTDLRYRAQYTEWAATLRITYVTASLDENSVLSLIDAAGFGVGVGEWRPEKSGDFGTFEIDTTRETRVISEVI